MHRNTRAELTKLIAGALKHAKPPLDPPISDDKIHERADGLSRWLIESAERYREKYVAYRVRRAKPEFPRKIQQLRKAMIQALVAPDVLLSTPQRQALTWLVQSWTPEVVGKRPTRQPNLFRLEFAIEVGALLSAEGLTPRWNQPGWGAQSLYTQILGVLLGSIGESGSNNPDKLARAALKVLNALDREDRELRARLDSLRVMTEERAKLALPRLRWVSSDGRTWSVPAPARATRRS